jgi:hypothetical protein
MFGMEFLDVAIGLVFVYLMLSLAVTAGNELFAAWFKRRAWMLKRAVGTMLDDRTVAKDLFDHPLIRSLQYGRTGPSYIPSRMFAIALLDVLPGAGAASSGAARAASDSLTRTLALLKKEAGADVDQYKDLIEVWFSQSMERVSGWYKRRTQVFLLLWAAVVTIGANADTFVIANALWRDPALRQAMVANAERYIAEQTPPAQAAQQPAEVAPAPPPLPPYEQADADFQEASAQFDAAIADLRAMELPLGWRARQVPAEDAQDLEPDALATLRLVREDSSDEWPGALWDAGAFGRWLQAVDTHKFGWLITILAVSLGAPFWFDTLNRIMGIRSAGRAPEEAPKAPKKVPTPREPGADDRPELA